MYRTPQSFGRTKTAGMLEAKMSCFEQNADKRQGPEEVNTAPCGREYLKYIFYKHLEQTFCIIIIFYDSQLKEKQKKARPWMR